MREHSFHKFSQHISVRDAAVHATIDDRIEFEFFTNMLAARTEQDCMAGCSIVAAIDRGSLGGNVLKLCMTDGAVLVGEVPNSVLR